MCSGAVAKVVINQTTVVMPTVTNMRYANCLGLLLSHFRPSCRKIETAAAAIIAETSDHALMRHQNQRSNSTVPVPAPVTSKIFQASWIEVIKKVTTTDAIISNTVTTWETIT